MDLFDISGRFGIVVAVPATREAADSPSTSAITTEYGTPNNKSIYREEKNMFKPEKIETAVKDNEFILNGDSLGHFTDAEAEKIYNFIISIRNGKEPADKVPYSERPNYNGSFTIGYHTEKVGNLYSIEYGGKLSSNGNYYTDWYALKRKKGCQDRVKLAIETLALSEDWKPFIKTVEKSFINAKGKEVKYYRYAFTTKKAAENFIKVLPTTFEEV